MARKVSIAEGHKLSREGKWIDNPKYDANDLSPHAEPRQIFKASYIVHFRPEPDLPEAEQYATVESAS
jgi:hypothetical protein